MLAYLCWGLFAVIAVADWFAVGTGDRRTEAVVKPAALLALTTAALAGGAAEEPAGLWLVGALLLGTVGDVLLLESSERRFLGGLSAFLVGHLAYVVSFALLGLSASWWLAGGVVALALSGLVAQRVLLATWTAGGPALAVPVALYTAVIGAMLVTGFATEQPLVAAGATVFVISDTVLALDRFARPARWRDPVPHVVVMVTYHLGQALIVLGVLAAL